MTHQVSYIQACPVCGRHVRIDVRLLGTRVYCQHCGGGFRAHDPSIGGGRERSRDEVVADLLERANHLLERVTVE